jgi:hypothetical protein
MNTSEPIQQARPMKGWALLALFGFGAWLVIGGWVSIAQRKWPGFMPPQLDFVALIGWFTSEQWAAYIGGGFVLLLGAALCLVAVVAAVRQHAA